MTKGRIRTLLVEDSVFMSRLISDVLKEDRDIELLSVARNGKEGVELFKELNPDVIVTDMLMPDYDGAYLVDRVLEDHYVPVILLSSLEKTDNRIFDALQKGAFDFIDKPNKLNLTDDNRALLIQLIKQAVKNPLSKPLKTNSKLSNASHVFDHINDYQIIAIGASTGGPGAVEYIIKNLPSNLDIPVVIVQHMPHRFLETFAARLNDCHSSPIVLASKGQTIKSGHIYIAPGDYNLRIERNMVGSGYIFTSTMTKYEAYNYPSVDCLFESIAHQFGAKSIAVLLTGMGKDGAEGMLKIKNAGGFTISQNEASCVVYGMPKAAEDLGASQRVVALDQIPGFIVSCL